MRVRGYRRFENCDLLETGGKTVVWGQDFSPPKVRERCGPITLLLIQPSEGVSDDGCGTPVLIGKIPRGLGRARKEFNGFSEESGAGQVVGQVCAALKVAGPPIERIEREVRCKHLIRFGGAAKAFEHHHAKRPGTETLGIEAECTVQVIRGGGPIGTAAIDLGEGVKGCGSPCLVPCGFIKRRIGLIVVPLVSQDEAEEIKRFPVGGVGVSIGETGDGRAGVAIGKHELATAQVPVGKSGVAT